LQDVEGLWDWTSSISLIHIFGFDKNIQYP